MEKSRRKKGDKSKDLECCNCHQKIGDEIYLRHSRQKDLIECINCFTTHIPEESEETRREVSPTMIVIDKNPKNIFTLDWNSNEELLLLNGVVNFGIGNWNKIAEWIPNHKPIDIETHYNEIYLKSQNAPLPDEVNPTELPETFPLPPPITYDTSPETNSNPSEKKNPSTNPAESNGWMKYRHEFENEFLDEADMIVGDLHFEPGRETEASFKDKLENLRSYNKVLVERVHRDEILEEFDIMHKTEPKTYFGGQSQKQIEIDEKLMPLLIYLKPEMRHTLIDKLHNGEKLNSLLDSCRKYQEMGAKTIAEGQYVNKLKSLIKDGRVTDPNQWNMIMDKIIEAQNEEPEDDLNEQEQSLVRENGINNELYLALKDIIIREFAINGSLTLEEAINLAPAYEEQIRQIYSVFVEFGWITQ